MIRTATGADIPRVVEMGLRFLAETKYGEHAPANPAQMAKTVEYLLASGGVLVSERAGELVGMIGYALFPHFISGELVAGEVFWWVEPEFRGEGVKLLLAAEIRAKDSGAVKMQMIAPDDKVAALYERLKYTFIESAYQKPL